MYYIIMIQKTFFAMEKIELKQELCAVYEKLHSYK
jgi:hypothetical protein